MTLGHEIASLSTTAKALKDMRKSEENLKI